VQNVIETVRMFVLLNWLDIVTRLVSKALVLIRKLLPANDVIQIVLARAREMDLENVMQFVKMVQDSTRQLISVKSVTVTVDPQGVRVRGQESVTGVSASVDSFPPPT